jgi:hypothetical protein
LDECYKTAIRDAVLIPDYFKFLQQRFGWDENTIDRIDWKLLAILTSFPDDRRPTLVKHIHSIAPTGKYVHRYDSSESAKCPVCDCPQETNDHVMQCPAPSRQQWRENTIRKIRSLITEPGTIQQLGDIVIAGLQCSFRGDRTFPAQRFPIKYQQVIHDQDSIGWFQLFRCRWAKTWSLISDDDSVLNSGRNTPAIGIPQWVKRCGRTLLNAWWELWTLRNEERHGVDRETTRLRLYTTLQIQLEELYSRREQVMPVDRNIYPYASAQAHLDSGTNHNSLLEWCQEHRSVILASCHQATSRGITRNHGIPQFILPACRSPATVSTIDSEESSDDSESHQPSSRLRGRSGRVGKA